MGCALCWQSCGLFNLARRKTTVPIVLLHLAATTVHCYFSQSGKQILFPIPCLKPSMKRALSQRDRCSAGFLILRFLLMLTVDRLFLSMPLCNIFTGPAPATKSVANGHPSSRPSKRSAAEPIPWGRISLYRHGALLAVGSHGQQTPIFLVHLSIGRRRVGGGY